MKRNINDIAKVKQEINNYIYAGVKDNELIVKEIHKMRLTVTKDELWRLVSKYTHIAYTSEGYIS